MKKLYYDNNGGTWEKVGRIQEIKTKYTKKRYIRENNANYYYFTDENGNHANDTMSGETELFLDYIKVLNNIIPLDSIANLYNNLWYGDNATVKLNNGTILSGCELDNYYKPLFFAIIDGCFQAYRKVN